MSDPRDYVAPSWDEIYAMLVNLAIKIKQSGFKPDLIVGVSRGGWAPGRILSDLLANTHTANIKIEFYVGINKPRGSQLSRSQLVRAYPRKRFS